MAEEEKRKRRGYTLMEMVLVQGVIVVLVAMGWPALRSSLGKSRLQESAKQVRIQLSRARLQAMETGTVLEFRFKPGERRYEIRQRAGQSAGEKFALHSAGATAHPSSTSGGARGSQSSDESVKRRELAEDVFFHDPRLTKDDSGYESESENGAASSDSDSTEHDHDDAGWSAPIVFYPNGQSTNALLRLNGPRDFHVDVTVRGLTGAVTISRLERDDLERDDELEE
jgi:Tfp pilus assembly protein FimT